MIRLLSGASRAALVVSVASLAAPLPGLATDFVVPAGTTDTTQKTLNGTDTLTVQATGALSVNNTAVTSNNTSTGIVITNSGTIESTQAAGRAINFGSGGATTRNLTLNNNAGATIQSQDDAFRINLDVASGSIIVNNAGTIRSTNGGQGLDFDAISAGTATVRINNAATGLIQGDNNDAIRPGQSAIVTNFGKLFSDGSFTGKDGTKNDGIDWQGHSGTVINKAGALISGFRHGITSDVDVNVTNEASATIIGRNGSGVGSDGKGTVLNFGTITGAYAGNGTQNGDGDGVDIDLVGNITNFGTIQGTGAGGVDGGGQPNGSEGIALGGGTIVNNAGALISGANNGILVDNGSLGPGVAATTIINAGTIRGLNGFGIKLVGNFDDTITNSGTISGSNGLAIDMGAGNDTLNIQTGSTIIGTIDGGPGTDTVNLSGTGTFAGAVNFESLNVQSGTWTLTGAQTYANGATVASGAALNVNGSLNNLVTVNSGGRLGGNGTVGSIVAFGTVAPGASIGTLTVTGNASFKAGSTYEVEANATGQADRINAASATLSGGTVQVLAAGGAYAPSTSYTIVSTTGGVTGQFAAVTSNLAFLDPALVYSANAVTLQLVRNGTFFTQVAQNTNQINVARALDTSPTDSPLFLSVVNQSAGGARTAFTALSGELGTSGPSLGLLTTGLFLSAMLDTGPRFGASFGPPAMAYAGEAAKRRPATDAFAAIYKAPPAAPAFESRWGSWATAFGADSRLDGNAGIGSNDLRARTGGVAGGLDYRVSPDTVVGVAVSGATGNFRLAGGLGSGDADTFQGGVYGTTWRGNFYFAGAAAFAAYDINNNRAVAFPGVAAQYRSDVSATGFGGRIEGGWRQTVAPGVGVTPYAALQTQTVWTPGYAETAVAGPATFALNYNSDSISRTRSELGVGFDSRTLGSPAAPFTVYGRAAWAHDFTRDRSITAAFQTLPGTLFTVAGASNATDVALVRAGAETRLANGVKLGARFEGEFGGGSNVYSGLGQISMTW